MLQGLPDDILIELVEVHLSDASNAQSRDAVCNLSLTSRRFRSFAIRVLYHSLSFHIDVRGPQDRMTSMIRNFMRAKHLIQSRHLLRNVQRLSLHHWDGDLPNSPGGDLGNDDVKQTMVVIYDNLTRLVPHMPRLREFGLVECAMTPFLYAAISACPLNLLYVDTDSPADSIHIPADLPHQKIHVTNLHYRYMRPTWKFSDDGNISDPYVARILEHSISSLEELSLDSGLLEMCASHINKALSFQYLSVTFPYHQRPGPVAPGWQIAAAHSLWNILLASPQLRSLTINGMFPEILLPQDLDHHFLPNLVQVSASPYVLRFLPMITQGRNLQRVDISLWFDVSERPITQLVQCSPMHLRQFSITCAVAQTVRELLDFILSLSVFNNLEYLDINYAANPNLWVGYDGIQISNTITTILQDLTRLHTCHIWGMVDYPILNSPPLSVDPQSLGHPSLKVLGVDFFTRYVWYWDTEGGWVQREWKPTEAHNWYDRNQFSEV